jgi:hypothetical protein
MNHQPFEEWLFADEYLDEHERQLLEAHMRESESFTQLSTSWHQVKGMLTSSPMVAPEAGFTRRWENRLTQELTDRHRRQSMWIFIFYALGALILLVMLASMLKPFLQYPMAYLLALAYHLGIWFAGIEMVIGITSTIMKTVIDLVPYTFWFGIFVALGSLSVLWMVVIKRLTSIRRIVV